MTNMPLNAGGNNEMHGKFGKFDHFTKTGQLVKIVIFLFLFDFWSFSCFFPLRIIQQK